MQTIKISSASGKNKIAHYNRLGFGMTPEAEKEIILQVARKVAPVMEQIENVGMETTIKVINEFKTKNRKLWDLVEKMKAERAFEDTFKYHKIQKKWLGDKFTLIDPVNENTIWKAVSQKFEIAVTKLAGVLSGKKQLRLTNYYGTGTDIPNIAILEKTGKKYAGPKILRSDSIVVKRKDIETENTSFSKILNNIENGFRFVGGGYANPTNEFESLLYMRKPQDVDAFINSY